VKENQMAKKPQVEDSQGVSINDDCLFGLQVLKDGAAASKDRDAAERLLAALEEIEANNNLLQYVTIAFAVKRT